jgi:hypothetical protein
MATAFKKFQQENMPIRGNTLTKETGLNICHTCKKSGTLGYVRVFRC